MGAKSKKQKKRSYKKKRKLALKRKKEVVNKVKCVEVIRGKRERENLEGCPCSECLRFYKASGMWKEGDDEHNRLLMKRISRHRHRRGNTPPRSSTPPGFWDLDFFESSDEENNNVTKKTNVLNTRLTNNTH